MNLFIGVLLLIIIKTAYSEHTLDDQNVEEIEPSANVEDDNIKEYSKRTIGLKNPGFAKHVGIHPLGHKYVLGYGPVDYKYVPVIKPLVLKPVTHSHILRPHLKPVRVKPVNLLPFKPVRRPINNGGWKPIIPPNVPLPSKHPEKPWQDGWPDNRPSVSLQPPFSASGQNDVHIRPAHGDVDVRPIVGVTPDVKPFFETPVLPLQPIPQIPAGHIHPVNPVVPSPPLIPHQHPAVYPQHLHPTLPLVPTFFHVHKPEFPVLPLGAAFPPELLNTKSVIQPPIFQTTPQVFNSQPVPPQSVFTQFQHAPHPHLSPTLPITPHSFVPSNPQPLPTFFQQIPSGLGHPIHTGIPTNHFHSVNNGIPPTHLHPINTGISTTHPNSVPLPNQPIHPVHALGHNPSVPPQPFIPSPIAPQEPVPLPSPSGVEFHGKAAHLIPLSRPGFDIHTHSQLPTAPENRPGIHIQPDTNFNPGIQAPHDQFNPHPHDQFNPHPHDQFNPLPHDQFNPHSHDQFNPHPHHTVQSNSNIPQGHFIPGVHQIPHTDFHPDLNFHSHIPQPQHPNHNAPDNFNPSNHDGSTGQFPSVNVDSNGNFPDVTHHFSPQPHDFPNNQNVPEQQPGISIQPGQTDLQIPFHLPNHPTFRQHDINVFQQNPTDQIPNSHDTGNSAAGNDATFNGYVK